MSQRNVSSSQRTSESREWSFLMSGVRETARGMTTEQLQSRGIKSIGRPRPGYENLFNNSFKKQRGAKTAGQFFMGHKTFRPKFEQFNFQDIYGWAYILKYFS